MPFVLLWGLAPWLSWMGLAALVGLLAVAVGARHSGGWPIGPSIAVVGSCFAVVALALVPAWLGVGATLIRRQI